MKFTPVILVILSILIFFFYIDPGYKSIKDRQDHKIEIERSLEEAKDLSTIRGERVSEYNNFKKSDKDRLSIMVSSEIDGARLFNNLAGIGSKNGVSLTQVSLGGSAGSKRGIDTVEGPEGVREESVGFTAQTSYGNFIAFLEDVEKSLQIMDIKAFKINPLGSESSVYKFEVQLTAYSL